MASLLRSISASTPSPAIERASYMAPKNQFFFSESRATAGACVSAAGLGVGVLAIAIPEAMPLLLPPSLSGGLEYCLAVARHGARIFECMDAGVMALSVDRPCSAGQYHGAIKVDRSVERDHDNPQHTEPIGGNTRHESCGGQAEGLDRQQGLHKRDFE